MKFKKSFMLHFLTYRFFFLGYIFALILLIFSSTYFKASEQLIPNYIYIFLVITTIQTLVIGYYENYRLSAIYLNINGDRIAWLISSIIFGIVNWIINLLLLFLLNFLFDKYANIPLFPFDDIFLYIFISSIYTLTYSLSSLLGIIKIHKKIIFKIAFVIVSVLAIIVLPFITSIAFNWEIFLFLPGINYLFTSRVFYFISMIIYLIYYFKIKEMNI